MNKRYLLLISIGPVQSFIASARRTRDLAFGSRLLSEHSKAVAKEIAEQCGSESLIFPATKHKADLNENSAFNVANKIVAIIAQTSKDKAPQAFAKHLKQVMDDRLESIRIEAYANFKGDLGERNKDIALDQVRSLPEFNWVTIPYDDEEASDKAQYYTQRRHLLETLMAARKNTRDFGAITWGSNLPKSSIDGVLESVIPGGYYPSRRKTSDTQQEILNKIQVLYEKFGAGPQERLSGVDLLKRHDKSILMPHPDSKNPSYPSTSHIAALPFLKRLEALSPEVQQKLNKELEVCVQNFKNIQVDGNSLKIEMELIPKEFPEHPIFGYYDGALLFEERISNLIYIPELRKRPDWQPAALIALREFIQSLDEELKAAGFPPASPAPYYALLQADGDGMGKAIDANQHGPDGHRAISKALSDFSRGVRAIVEEHHKGVLIYAGGDDVMALLPLHTVLDCAQELADSFKKILLETLAEFNQTEVDSSPTLSVGVAIVHHLELLRDARAIALQAEQLAKSVAGKNALAIILKKRGGEPYSLKGTWGTIDKDLRKFIEYSQEKKLPAGTAYELREATLPLLAPHTTTGTSTQQTSLEADVQEVIKQEALRIFHRKLFVPRGKFPEAEARKVESYLKQRLGIHEQAQGSTPSPRTTPIPIKELIDELIIARTLADASEMASPKQEKRDANLDH